jgi:hypothetical protein
MEDLKISNLRPCLVFVEVDGKTGQDVKVIDSISFPKTYKSLQTLQRDWQRDADSGRCVDYWQSTRKEGAESALKVGNKISVRVGLIPFNKE